MNQHMEMTRFALIEKADQLLANYKQYRDYHDNWVLVRATKNLLWKSGAKMGKDNITIGTYESDVLEYSGRWIVAVFHFSFNGWTVYHCSAQTSDFNTVL